MDRVDDLIHRDRGILTKNDRKYLLNELDEELSDNAEYQKRHKIRNRIQNSIIDFQIIQGQLAFKDIELIFDETHEWARDARLVNENRGAEFPELPKAVNYWSAMIQFFAFGQFYSQINESILLVRHTIEQGIERAMREYGFEFSSEYYESESSLTIGVENRYRLLNYIQHIEENMPYHPEEAEEYLFDLYSSFHLSYSMYVYLFEKHISN